MTKAFQKLKWVIIGAETGRNVGKVIPKAEWIKDILTSADATDTPVFMRSSMESVVGAVQPNAGGYCSSPVSLSCSSEQSKRGRATFWSSAPDAHGEGRDAL